MKSYRPTGVMITFQGTSIIKGIVLMVSFLFAVFLLSGILTSLKPEYRIMSSSVNSAAMNVTSEWLYELMGMENHYFLKSLGEKETSIGLTNLVFKLSTNVNLDDPRSLLGRELPGFSIFDGKIVVAGEGTNYTNMPMESAPPIEVLKGEQEAALQNIEDLDEGSNGNAGTPPPQSTGERKVVYIYFTHTQESYLPYLKGVTSPSRAYHPQVNVTRIGDKLKESLESKGIGTTVDKTDVMANVSKKGLTFGHSYQESRPVVQQAMAQNRELQYFIDIHRDGLRKDKTTIDINGQSYAKLAFVIGGENAQYEKNLKLAKALHDMLDKQYGKGLSRGIIKKEGAGTNGKFNQDLSENALLIEFGGVDNTFEELNRSAEALADVFSEFFWQAEQVNKPVETGN